MATLDDLKDVLTSIETTITTQSKTLTSLLDLNVKMEKDKKKRDDLSRAERTTSKRNDSSQFDAKEKSESFKSGDKFGEALLGALLGTSNIASFTTTLTAGVAAVGAAALGMRGWEDGIIKSMRNATMSLSDTVISGATKLRDNILIRFFGFVDPTKRGRDPLTGRFTRGIPMTTQITRRITEMKTAALAVFGLGADGKPLVDISGKLSKPIVGRLAFWIGKLLSPLSNALDGIRGFATGGGRAIFEFMGRFGSSAASFGKVFFAILKPIGFIYSIWQGVQDFMKTEGTFIEKLGAGIGGFFGDFLGAPFDLIKNSIAWIVGKLFGVESTDGKYDESMVIGRVLNLVKEFSFEEMIKSIVRAPFDFAQSAFEWIKGAFSDPIGTLTDLWESYIGVYATIGGWVGSIVEKLVNWFVNKFLWDTENEDDQFDLSEYISETWTKVSSYFADKFNAFANFISNLPESISLHAQDMWNNTKEKIQLGFLDLSEWLMDIPKKMLAMVMNILGSVKFTVPDWVPKLGGKELSLVDQADVAAANAAVGITDPRIAEKRSEIISAAEKERSRIASEFEKLQNNALSGITVAVNAPSVSPTNISGPTTITNVTGGTTNISGGGYGTISGLAGVQ